ncbi:hypothetical protein [Desulfotomaculum copahuensis]|uniref:Phage tail tape measure protein n=1 Tax=Desulfotomaculum copahuensis TaxID=1838280 RepID=A0A1B7LDE3_9FIRM|nr:hypothetical protein [Desulfotomaculum copahuensis]OAT81107.1 hypothetical protein A6M21_11900 [Desulfotomaculum copahuensis]
MAESNYRISLVLQLHDRMTAALNKIDSAARKVENRTKRLDRVIVSPTVRLIDRASHTIVRIGSGLHSLSSRTWNMTIRARDIASGVIGRIKNSLFSLQGMAAVALGALGAGKLWDATAGAAMIWETQAVSMEHWLKGNKDLAREVTGWLERFAAATPFEMQDLFPSMTRAIGISEGDVKMAERMVKLAADMAGLTPGKTVQDAMEALADAQMGEFERLKEFQMKMTQEEYKKLGGFVGFLEEAERRFAGGAEKLSQTALGRLSTITDTVKTFFRQAGIGILESMKPRLDRVTEWFGKNEDTVERWKTSLVRFGREGAEQVFSFFERAFARLGRILDDPKFQKMDFWGKVKFIIDDISAGIKDWLDSGGRDKIVAVGREIGGFLFSGIKMGVTEALKGLGKLNIEAIRKPTAENIGSAALADVLAISAGSALLGPVFRAGKWIGGIGKRAITALGGGAGAGVAAASAGAAAETAATATAATKGINIGQILRDLFVNPASKRALEPLKRTVIPGTPEQVFHYRGFLPGGPTVEAFRIPGTAAKTVGGGWAPLRYIGQFGKVGDFLSRWALPITLATGAAEVALARPEERLQTGMKVGGRIAGGLAGASLGAKAGAAIGTFFGPGIGTAIGGAIGGLGGGILGAFGGEAIMQRLSGMLDMVDFSSLKEKAISWIKELPGEVAEHIGYIAGYAVEKLSQLPGVFSEWSQQAKDSAIQWIMGLPDQIAGFVESIPGRVSAAIESVKDAFLSLGKAIPEAIVGGFNWAKERIGAAGQWIIDKAMAGVEAAKSLGKRLVEGFEAGRQAAKEPVTAHALGGILTRPHLGLVAEAGPEAVIPLSARLRPRALELWRETGRRLGVQQFEFGGFTAPVAVAGGGISAPTVNLNFDLAGLVGQITVQGRDDLEQAADQIAAVIAAKLKAIFYNLPG